MPARSQPFSFEGLPHLPAWAAGRSRLLARALATRPERRVATVRGLGRVSARIESVDPAPWDATGGDLRACTLALVRDGGGSLGRLTFDPFFALALVRGALGLPAPAVVRPLAPSERGVLAALVAAVLSGTGRALAVGLARPRLPEGTWVAVNLAVGVWDLWGSVRVDIPLPWLGQERAAVAVDAAPLIATDLRLELARTQLPRGSVAGAEAGDAVLFAGVSAPVGGAAWPCVLAVADHRAPGEVAADGRIRCTGVFTPTSEAAMKDASSSDPNHAAAPLAPEGAAEAAAMLAEAPVEVVAELGRLTLRGDELVGLARGAVLALGPRRPEVVTLRVAGQVWATGELVTLEDQLGVRITGLRHQP